MLVLSRKVGERIVIGDGIVITLLGVQNQRVRVGIEAPESVHIRREELAPLDETAGAKEKRVGRVGRVSPGQQARADRMMSRRQQELAGRAAYTS